jgi:tripartite-type tricarboxylate transporter receptor subunit TctC
VLNGKPGIDAQNELAPVTTIATTPMILVVKSSAPAKDAQELIARARAMPGRLNYSSAGPGTTLHLYAELFKLRTGTDIVHIPFKGTAPALQALIAGDVDLCFAPVPSVLPLIKAGRLRALATTGAKRSDLLPEIPTMREAGVEGMDASVWYGVFAPAATPSGVINVLARAILDASRAPDYRQRLLELGEEPSATSPEAFRRLLREEMAKWSEVIKVAHIRAD